MTNVNLTPIEVKKQEKEANSEIKTNNWKNFGLSLISNLIVTLLIGISGSNFIYLTNAASKKIAGGKGTLLDILLPSDEGFYFPKEKFTEEKMEEIKDAMGDQSKCGDLDCKIPKEFCTNFPKLYKFNIGKPGGFPYDIKDTSSSMPAGVWQKFKNWFADGTANSYMRDRSWLKKTLTFFAPDPKSGNMFANNSFQMFIVTPLMYLIFPLLLFIIFGSTLFSLFNKGPLTAFLGFFFLYTFFIIYGISCIKAFQYIATLLFVPLLADFKLVKKIFICNGKSLLYFFLFLTCTSAYSNFDNTTATTMLVLYILVLIKGYW